MKTRITISVLLLILTVLFILENSSEKGSSYPNPPPGGNISDSFLIGAMTDGIEPNYQLLRDSLGFNLWHKYIGGGVYPNGQFWVHGWTSKDTLEAPINWYQGDITSILGENQSYGMRTLMERPKTTRLAFGQRSDYQCESSGYDTSYWFYTFQTHGPGTDIPDSGGVVRYCEVNYNQTDGGAGWVAKRLKANNEQCNTNIGRWEGDNYYQWLIKPRIRIDSAFANNPNNQNVPVYKIDVYNWNDTLIKSTIVRCRNFIEDVFHPYRGNYLEEYFFTGNDSTLIIPSGYDFNPDPEHNFWVFESRGSGPDKACHADYQVYWYGNCDMWIDYVRVDNDVADNLLSTDPNNPTHILYEQWLQWEAQDIGGFNNLSSPLKFYIEEFEFNNIPCMAYVSRKLNEYSSGRFTLMSALNYTTYNAHLPLVNGYPQLSFDHAKRCYLDSVGSTELFAGSYALLGRDTAGFQAYLDSRIPNTLPYHDFNIPEGRLAIDVDPANYDDWLQRHFDTNWVTFYKGEFTYYMKNYDNISKQKDIPFINLAQAHIWYSSGHKMREPTNEELEMTTDLAITYGARGNLYFWYGAGQSPPWYWYGLLSNSDPITPRYENAYGQPKWNKIKEIDSKLKTWGPTLMSFTNSDRHSYIYRLANERGALITDSYFRRIASYKPGNPMNNCVEGDSPYPPDEQSLEYECQENTYLQVAIFKEYSSGKRTYPYFMIVNRRCSPVKAGYPDGKRTIKVLFDSDHNEIGGYNEWVIKDMADDRWRREFNKTQSLYVDLGEFNPGEGRLYHLVPKMQSGGVLQGDEYIESGEPFTCEDTVWTNGHNLTIEDGVTIHFSDSAAFVVNGGTFQIGNSSHSGPNTINMDADNSSWKGFVFDSATVKIYGVNFSGLANDSISILTFIDCPVIDLRSNSFSLGSNNNVAALDINYSGSYGSSITDNIYLSNNTFTGSNAVLPHVKVMAYSGITTPVIVEGNIFEGTSTALFLNNIQGGAIKSNTFTGFGSAVTALSSSLDVFSNTVSSTANGSYGLEALEGTELKMSYSGGLLVGGRNNITNSSSNSDNIYLENSYFLMDEGENIFDIGTSSYHLNGWFPDSYSGEYLETENCFKVQGSVVDPPLHYVTLGEQGNQITGFVFTPYLTGCTQGGEGDMMVINLGNGIYDTIGIMGQGGSYSSNYIVTPKSIYDSISISMRYRNYANVKTLCLQLLNTYPDSVQSLGAVSKLYLAVSKTDTTAQGITDLKTLYENLILNHSTNISLVKRCNYYIQKCKVLLHQYSSALSGFQQIINNNPASYEGLIARWDYMATSLLMQGQGGALSGVEGSGNERNWDFGLAISDLNNNESDKFDDDKFSKEERKQIKQAVTTALETSKSAENKRREVLTELSTRGDVKATKQLKVLKSLEQTVKVEKPKNIVEHMKIVSSDIQKVFVNPNAGKNANTIFIPQVFHLSQNYPNPFNPLTKINYDIPQNSIVKLTIYDILGREVIKLVNNEFKQPGRYVVEFNGTNLASGVYFYRIEANDFIDSKKMVLVK